MDMLVDILKVNIMDNELETYDIHDNGGVPFRVSIDRGNKLCKINCSNNNILDDSQEFNELEDSYEQKYEYSFAELLTIKYVDIYVGDVDDEDKGSNILCHLGEGIYMHIGWEIFLFCHSFGIKQFHTPIENNDVPYPYAIDECNNCILLSEKVILENFYDNLPSGNMAKRGFNYNVDCYGVYYGHVTNVNGYVYGKKNIDYCVVDIDKKKNNGKINNRLISPELLYTYLNMYVRNNKNINRIIVGHYIEFYRKFCLVLEINELIHIFCDNGDTDVIPMLNSMNRHGINLQLNPIVDPICMTNDDLVKTTINYIDGDEINFRKLVSNYDKFINKYTADQINEIYEYAIKESPNNITHIKNLTLDIIERAIGWKPICVVPIAKKIKDYPRDVLCKLYKMALDASLYNIEVLDEVYNYIPNEFKIMFARYIIEYLPDAVEYIEDLCLEEAIMIAKKYPLSVCYVPKQYQTSEMIYDFMSSWKLYMDKRRIEENVRCAPRDFNFIRKDLFTFDVCKKYLELDGETYLDLPNEFHVTELLMIAIKTDPYVFSCVNDDEITLDVCKFALDVDYKLLADIIKLDICDYELLKYAVVKNVDSIKIITKLKEKLGYLDEFKYVELQQLANCVVLD